MTRHLEVFDETRTGAGISLNRGSREPQSPGVRVLALIAVAVFVISYAIGCRSRTNTDD